jgi:hypothetical protein
VSVSLPPVGRETSIRKVNLTVHPLVLAIQERGHERKDLTKSNERPELRMEFSFARHSPGCSKSTAIVKKFLMFALLIGLTVRSLEAARHPTARPERRRGEMS